MTCLERACTSLLPIPYLMRDEIGHQPAINFGMTTMSVSIVTPVLLIVCNLGLVCIFLKALGNAILAYLIGHMTRTAIFHMRMHAPDCASCLLWHVQVDSISSPLPYHVISTSEPPIEFAHVRHCEGMSATVWYGMVHAFPLSK